MLGRLIAAVSNVAECAFSRRALVVALLLVAALVTSWGWLRPPLSCDLTSLHLPLGILKWSTAVPDAAVARAEGWRIFSPGVVLLIAIITGIVLIFRRPNWIPFIAGGLLSLAIWANAVVLLNHPLLVESLERELVSRQNVAAMIMELNESSVTVIGQARVSPISAAEQSTLWSAWPFRRYGMLLVVLAVVGLLFALHGPLSRRLGVVAIFAFIGITCGGLCCSQRLLAESFWSRAQGLEMIGQTSNARANLERAVLIMPELGQLERTWLLAGRIDLDEGLTTNATRFLRAERLAQAADWHAALDASRELRQTADDSTAVRRQAAQLFALAGLSEYRLGRLTAAYDAWRRGFEIDPARLDCPCYLGLVQARLDRTHPDESRRWIDLVLPRLGDRLLRADLLSSLGDAYFEAGQFAEARTFYRDSLRVYDLPKEINYRGRKGLLGM